MVKKILKKILIIDEDVFTQVCSAILGLEGYKIETHKTCGGKSKTSNLKNFGLIVTSYPYCIPVLRELKEIDIPKIILFDNLNIEMITFLKNLTQSFCMVKPIDFSEFRSLVKEILIDNNAEYFHGVNII